MHNPLVRLTNLLRDNGIPMDGIRALGGGNYQVIWLPTATAADKARAASLLAAADRTPRRARGYAAIMADLAALPQADLNKLLLLFLADWLIDNPDVAARVGVDIPGDEPDI